MTVVSYKPQHLKRGTAKGTPGYVGRHRVQEDSAPVVRHQWFAAGECAPDSCPLADGAHLHEEVENP